MVLRNGAEYEHFARTAPPPAELPVGQTVIGYAGAVAQRLDFTMLLALADAEPDWTVALVGDTTVEVPVRPNLKVFGTRSYGDMPAWMQRFDVGVIPLHLTPHILSAFPLKTYEYLAAGRPVVASAMPMLSGMEPFVRIAHDPADFVAQVHARR